MVGTYNSLLVLLSILVAIFVSYTAAQPVRASGPSQKRSQHRIVGRRRLARHGLWHLVHAFIGMLAFSLPIH